MKYQDLEEEQQEAIEYRIAELLDLDESWDRISAEAEALRELEQAKLEMLRHV